MRPDFATSLFSIRPRGFEPLTFGSGDQRSIRTELRARGLDCNNLQKKGEPKSSKKRLAANIPLTSSEKSSVGGNRHIETPKRGVGFCRGFLSVVIHGNLFLEKRRSICHYSSRRGHSKDDIDNPNPIPVDVNVDDATTAYRAEVGFIRGQ